MNKRTPEDILDIARVGFSGLSVRPSVQEAALEHMLRWLTDPHFGPYRPQIVAQADAGRFGQLLDSFHQVLPFGTGGRRGTVGIGPNRFNGWTLGASVQGHATFLRRTLGDGPIAVVLAYDVRRFRDLGGQLVAGVPDPVMGLSSRDFALVAAEVYAAADITVWLPPEGRYVSTPELSFAIRHLGAQGGLNISASHNPPDDNGGKIYDASGGQATPPRDEEMAELVESVSYIDRMSLDRARAAGLVRELPAEVHEAYVQANLATSRSPTARGARVVFTALHGTGRDTVYEVLRRAGFSVELEPTQAEYDGAFPHVPFRVPNPEVQRSMDAAVAHAEKTGADIVMACDPDADRLGLCAREHLHDPSATDPVRWRFMSGNEIAALICHYRLSRRASVTPPLVIKTEVTSSLVSRVARARGARVIGNLLVGFKYIGAALDQLERTGRYAGVTGRLEDFALGAEESHGILVTTAVRDKDAAGGALALAELASLEKARGRTLVDTLRELWETVGYVRNELVSTVMRGAEGKARIAEIQEQLRARPLREIGGRQVTAFHDRQDPDGPFGPILSGTDRASRDVLVWELGEEARVILRPSGTEPKNKVYVELCGRPGAPLSTEIPRVNAACRTLAEDFTLLMLGLVGIRLTRWALRVSDLVSVEHKQHFADTVMPELIARLSAADAQTEAVGRWLDGAIAPYGRDARALVGDAVRAYVNAERPACGHALLKLLP